MNQAMKTDPLGRGQSIQIRREFRVDPSVCSGSFRASADGWYYLWVNGHPVTEAPQQGQQSRDEAYDVTGFLEVDPVNVISLIVMSENLTGEMILQREDGSTQILPIDESWHWKAYPSRQKQQSDGRAVQEEYHDAREEEHGFEQRGFHEYWWEPLVPASDPCPIPPRVIRNQTRIHPQEVITTAEGEWILDMGQVVHGSCEVVFWYPPRRRVCQLEFCLEDPQKKNVPAPEGEQERQISTYICRGEAEEFYHALFTAFDYRYVKVLQWPYEKKPGAKDFTGIHWS